ncbi:MAG: hypothetical protein WDW36_000125 [Sanguina aurantia]
MLDSQEQFISRWLPVVGALGVGAYAYHDTGQVAKTAIALFGGNMEFIDDPDDAHAGVDPDPAVVKVVPKPTARKKAATAAGKAVKKAVKKVARKAVDAALSSTARKIASTADKAGKAAKKKAASRPRKPNSE